jgi:hypothetical protein
METLYGALGIVDRAHRPHAGAANAAAYKEWYHFNVMDPGQRVDLIVNLSLAGDVLSIGRGRTDVIALAHVGGNVWHGGIDSFEGTAAHVAERELDIRVGDSSVVCREGLYHVSVAMRDRDLATQLRLAPHSEPMLVWNDTPIGSGSINWLIVPHLLARGDLRAGDREIVFDGACAYHDHNWGHWRWGEDLAWTWGFATEMSKDVHAGRAVVVFDRTSDRTDTTAVEQTLAVWQQEKLTKLFVRRMLRARRSGRFGERIRRVPGAMNLVASGKVLDVPAALEVSARDGEDWIDAVYHVEAAVQIAIPSEFGFGVVGLNETFGMMTIEGMIGGAPLAYQARACFEFM